MRQSILVLIAIFSISILNAQTKIIMEKKGGVYIIPCKVNGVPLEFIFDTGASNVTISLAEAVFMIKNGHLDKSDIHGSSYAQLANGDIIENTKILLKVIEIADLKLYDVQASIVHELGASLLLGQTAIEKLGKIQLEGNELIIMTKGNKHYDYTTKFANVYPYNHTFTGYQSVVPHSPILEKPDMANSSMIGSAENSQVTIIEKINDGYYKVKSGNIVGYLWAGWFKK